MITPSPSAVRALLARYAVARFAHEQCPDDRTVLALEDVTYTLCVVTACRTVAEALAAADALLEKGAAPGVGAVDHALGTRCPDRTPWSPAHG
ncbi:MULTISPECIES: DUF5133 domain-containing protein [unclassified Streptomyces]|uniref:DUF5133 domain-containing protein n=1 Tax=unclassified Streptomyces TaxID=2593676 RepID=UPI000DB9317C|nr:MULTISPECIES: DUF5133 domain-containing protein [unclassified Streptomyces]MYT74934.1 DUF5133 domain-containing protein [Streptomyces sp. SID8367]RAJ91926.1 uncharacterized protein DUF5133 [Streptomyces sp. PsTaAH-137]